MCAGVADLYEIPRGRHARLAPHHPMAKNVRLQNQIESQPLTDSPSVKGHYPQISTWPRANQVPLTYDISHLISLIDRDCSYIAEVYFCNHRWKLRLPRPLK